MSFIDAVLVQENRNDLKTVLYSRNLEKVLLLVSLAKVMVFSKRIEKITLGSRFFSYQTFVKAYTRIPGKYKSG